MLSSIHPLGERGRNNRWVVTAASFTIGSTATGALVGATLGWIGAAALRSVSTETLLLVTAMAAISAGALDLLRLSPLSSERQVNETWIGHYRGWVYGGAFGVQLGLGIATYIVTWGVYATFVAELMTASVFGGAVVGAVFGFGRSVALLAAGTIHTPSALTRFHENLADLGPTIRRGAAIGTASLGAVLSLVVLI